MAAAPDPARRPVFATTRWSMVARTCDSDPDVAKAALSELCAAYWYPLYAFLRRRGRDAEEARDLTQGFLAHLLARRDLVRADPSRGRFRSFLLTAAKHWLANRREAEHAQERGGGIEILSLDFVSAEGRFRTEPADYTTPERLFEAAWARELLDRTMEGLRRHFVEKGQGALFDALQANLAGTGEGASYAEIAIAQGMTEGAIKVAVHRMRRRFRSMLRREIGDTVQDPGEIDDEIRALFAALG